jgi:hypothetical protein
MISFDLPKESTLGQESTVGQVSTLGQEFTLHMLCLTHPEISLIQRVSPEQSEINGFMPQGESGQRIPDIYTITTRHIPLRMDSPEIPSRGLNDPDEPTRKRDDYLVSPVVGIVTLSETRDREGATPEADLIGTLQSEFHFIMSSEGRSHSYSAVGA